jgi:methylated-DNA-[protein]-cysteine S-methyltransferase
MTKMTRRESELIAIVLGDIRPSTQMKGWLETGQGRRELAAYQEALRMLSRLYSNVSMPEAKEKVYYAPVRTPVGNVLVAATAAGLVRVSYSPNETAFVTALRRMKLDVIRSAEKIKGIAAQLEAYFAGKRRTFDVPIDLRHVSPFQRSVLMAACQVPAGQVVSYREIARRIGRPQASRAVGQALGHNPIPIIIPCHRIVTSSGGLGGYTGGLEIKKKLLQIEGVAGLSVQS